MNTKDQGVEWPTLILLAATYTLWALATSLIYLHFPAIAILLAALAIAQFSSLQHEILHGHPFRSTLLNEALAFPALNLTVPYFRFRDTHLAHHHDPILTDPYDDPESNYCEPQVWATLPAPAKALMRVNNTLLGRVTIGPILGNGLWLKNEAILLWNDAPGTRRAWALHAAGLALVALWLYATAMPWWAYLLATYLGHAALKIRTFLEHRAHEAARARTVIVEDRGPLALLFLNNNLHVVHHMHPSVPWYRLPGTYAANRDHYLRRNDNYVYRSYAEVFRRYLLKAKDPVPHPLMPASAAQARTVQTTAEAIT